MPPVIEYLESTVQQQAAVNCNRFCAFLLMMNPASRSGIAPSLISSLVTVGVQVTKLPSMAEDGQLILVGSNFAPLQDALGRESSVKLNEKVGSFPAFC